MQSTNLDTPRAKDGKLLKGAVINPKGKGGFQDRPQDRSDGRWSKEGSISYNYNMIMRMPAEEIYKYKPETVAQAIAHARVRAAMDARLGLGDAKEITDRTEGKAPQAIDLTSSDGSMTPQVIIENVYATKPKFRPDNQTSETDELAADSST